MVKQVVILKHRLLHGQHDVAFRSVQQWTTMEPTPHNARLWNILFQGLPDDSPYFHTAKKILMDYLHKLPNVYILTSLIHRTLHHRYSYQPDINLFLKPLETYIWTCSSVLVASPFNAILSYHAKHGNITGALQVLDTMRALNIEPDMYSCNIFVSLYRNVGDLDTADELQYAIRNSKLHPTDILNLIFAYDSSRKLTDMNSDQRGGDLDSNLTERLLPTTP